MTRTAEKTVLDTGKVLTTRPDRHHGVQGVQIATTAIVAAMRRACVPAGVQSLPTNLHNQDIVPFGTQAALTALEQAHDLRILHGSLAVGLRLGRVLRIFLMIVCR
ncbi:aromatic amino acid lyase [Lentzea sp. CC55]|uniref:aromatic amino acid lyase n=1 Tax=Lentzea sp. CC55 TaxID=2884909 RepID=UPI001F408A76|nr:aromatic amino acid lyase [Lentzea sp. CC55]MCG8928199.1 aromatic amino acid lyase [Lentzea sp. CC55]